MIHWHALAVEQRRQLHSVMRAMLTEDRAARIETVCKHRTLFVQLAIEDLVAANNAGNVLRTCDCLGVQSVHLFGNYDMERIIGIAKGSHGWLSVQQYDQHIATVEHVRQLRQQQDLQLVVTTPHNPTVTLDEFVPTKPTLLFFGSEVHGVSSELLAEADERLAVPLFGFCESLNVSTCAGMMLYTLLNRVQSYQLPWQLTEAQALDVSIEMMCHSIGERAPAIVSHLMQRLME